MAFKNIKNIIYGLYDDEKEIYYGYKKEKDSYFLAEFDQELKPNGFGVEVLLNKVIFARYEHGQILYPYVNLLNNGDARILLCKKNNLITALDINLKESSLHLYRKNILEDKIGSAIFYDGLTHTFKFQKYDICGEIEDEASVAKKFILDHPILSHHKIEYPKELPIEDFKSYIEDIAKLEFPFASSMIQMIIGKDGLSEISTKPGYHLHKYENYFLISYQNKDGFDGLQIEVDDEGEIKVNTLSIENHQIKESATLRVDGEEVILGDMDSSGSKYFARMRYLSELAFNHGEGYDEFYYSKREFEEKNQDSKIIIDTPEYKIMHMIGQEDAKKEFKRIKAYVEKNNTRSIYKNIVFSGENGVGKSTVGRLITKVLYKYGGIERDSYYEKSAKELFDNSTGATTKNLSDLYYEASGGVLLIEDLHYLEGLNLSNVKEGLIALSNLMEADKNTCFILCDNKYNMNQILANYKELFQDKIRFKVNFRDFSKDELKEILRLKVIEKGYTIEEDALASLLDAIFLAKTYGNNINATAALAILEEIIIIQNVRTELFDDKTIKKDDIDVYVLENDISFIDQKTGYQSEARKKLDELIGLKEIKETVDDLIAYFAINRGKRVDFHMAFYGNPGTGKTEVARIIGKLLCQEGILGTNKFIEVTRRDLIGQYVGQSAILTRDIIDKSMGGVLYIDEAYSLAYGGKNDFGPEVIAELLKAMEDRRGEFCVILSGYTNEMKKLFDLNPGFKSRIKFELEFKDYSFDELKEIARVFLLREGYTMEESTLDLFIRLVSNQRKLPNFANVRSLRNALSKVEIKHAGRLRQMGLGLDSKELSYDDIKAAFKKEELDEVLYKEEDSFTFDSKILFENQRTFVEGPFDEKKDELAEATLALRMSGENKMGEASGFIITKDGYFITSAHCVRDMNQIIARRRIMHHKRYIDLNYEVDVILRDDISDIALCKLNSDMDEEFDYFVLAPKGFRMNPLDTVYIMGYPFGVSKFDEMSINIGKITSIQRENERMLSQINLDIEGKGGNSGSPLIDGKTSMVVGIFSGSTTKRGELLTEEINYARPMDYFWKLLENKEDK